MGTPGRHLDVAYHILEGVGIFLERVQFFVNQYHFFSKVVAWTQHQ